MSIAQALAEALDPVAFARGRGFVAESWQSRLMRTTARRVVVPCARQVGKTETVSYKTLHTALHHAKRDVLIISPTQRQSDEFLLRVAGIYRGMSEAPRLKRDNQSEMGLANGSRVVSLPGSAGTVRGYANIKLLVIDEAAYVEDEVFASVLPMVGSDGQIIALSTPWGQRGWFWGLVDEAPRNGWEKHRVTVHDSAQYDAARIAEVRAAVGSFVFASDYLAEFTDTSEQMFGTEDVRRAFTPSVLPLFTA